MSGDADFDAVIVGAGPAGSSAAIQLARAGRAVLLVDKQRFPRAKVCGGCLSGAATARLKRLVKNRALPGTAGSKITFVMGPLRATCHPRGTTLLALRSELDACLTEEAAAAGASTRFGEPARLARDAVGWRVMVGGDAVGAKTVLLACGVGGLSAQLGVARRRCGAAMIGQQWVQHAGESHPAAGCVELHWLRGGYIGFATLDDRRCMVALATRTDCIAGGSALNALRDRNPGAQVWELLRGADHPSVKGAAGFPWIPRRLGRDNVLLIGDAAGYVEPFTGEGIAQAMFSADCACRAIGEGGDVLRTYTSAMRRHRRRLWRTRMLSLALGAIGRVSTRTRWGPVDRLLSYAVDRIHVGSFL